MNEQFNELRNGVMLAELGGYGDGPYCAEHGKGAALVMLGTYIVDAGDDVPYPKQFVFKPGRENYAEYLRQHVAAARGSGAQVGVSVVSVDIANSVDFLRAAEKAEADYVSLCAHSTMEMFIRAGVSSALCRRENWSRLRERVKAILDADQIPVIIKVGATDTPDTTGAVEVLSEIGVRIVNVNVGKLENAADRPAMLSKLSSKCDFLIGGGGIGDAETARRYLEAGAGAVAVGKAAMDDPDFCGRVQSTLRSNTDTPSGAAS